MLKTKCTSLIAFIAGLLTLLACSDPNTEANDPAGSAPVAVQTTAPPGLLTNKTLERLMARSEPRVPPGATAPGFVVDPSWPKPLPNNWLIGQVGGLTVDSHDNVWVYHRGRSLDESSVRGLGVAGTDANGSPIDALGFSRALAEQIAGCCGVAPAVLKFDTDGNLLDAWGGPQDPDFLANNCREADGCFWPGTEHGIYVDHNDFVYVSGNGTGATG